MNKKKSYKTNTNECRDLSGIEQERYRVFIEGVTDGFFETNLKGDFTFYNNSFSEKLFGLTTKEMKSMNYRKFMDEENSKLAFKTFNQLYKKGHGLANCTWNIKNKNGETHILEVTVELIFDNEKNIVGFRGIAQDITEKHFALQKAIEAERNARKRYRESRRIQKRFQSLLQFLPDPVLAFNLDNMVEYVNPGFEKVFGWTANEIKKNHGQLIPDFLKDQAQKELQLLLKKKSIKNLKTKRMTKDGRLLDIIMDGAIFNDEENRPVGYVLTLRDFTRQNRLAKNNQILFNISQSLHHYHRLDDLLASINQEIKNLIAIEGAFVILLDEQKEEFYFFSASYGDYQTRKKFNEIRFPADQGVTGRVYQIGEPLIIHDVSTCTFFLKRVDEESGLQTKNILSVPIQLKDRIIGVLTVINKLNGKFDQTDTELLSTIASTIALPIENTRINEELRKSYKELKNIDQAKDRVIHHLSHELKTPIAVLSSTVKLLSKKLKNLGVDDEATARILRRGERNLKRLLEIQYEVEDLLKKKNHQVYQILTKMLEACKDEIEILIENAVDRNDIIPKIRKSIDELFGPKEIKSKEIQLDEYLKHKLKSLEPKFSHRKIAIKTSLDKNTFVHLPIEILDIVAEGLIRNAVENTPDHGMIEIMIKRKKNHSELMIKDYGVGLTEEKQHLIFENYFSPPEIDQYSTKKPYDFNAGGKGFDLLRMKIFSEQYHFKIHINSDRCKYIPRDEDLCPGDIKKCPDIMTDYDCFNSGYSSIDVRFPRIEK